MDSLGIGYDYGSIIALPNTCFLNRWSYYTSEYEYRSQGSPLLGQLNGLSARDIQQVKLMYKCHGFGINGRLRIKVHNGVNQTLMLSLQLYTI